MRQGLACKLVVIDNTQALVCHSATVRVLAVHASQVLSLQRCPAIENVPSKRQVKFCRIARSASSTAGTNQVNSWTQSAPFKL